MIKTAAEYQKAYRDRKAAQAKLAGDPTDAIAKTKWHAYLTSDDWNEILNPLEWAGIDPDHVMPFESDADPDHRPEDDGPYRGSIGRAERMVGNLLDAAAELASKINAYKRKEITDRILEIENTDYHDHFVKSDALKEHARLQKMLDQLDKQVRWTVPQWRVTGV